MSSGYSESVKFYENMSELHRQLKTYDETQYSLQDELERLLKRPAIHSEVDLVDQQVLVTSPRLSGLQSNQNGKVTDPAEEARRHHRNQILLEKAKELESTASVFAARSEKLRVMRREYEMLVKKYMSCNRNSSKSISTEALPVISSAQTYKGFSKMVTSTGVNTIITGPIRSLNESEKYLEASQHGQTLISFQGDLINQMRFHSSQAQYKQSSSGELNQEQLLVNDNVMLPSGQTLENIPMIQKFQELNANNTDGSKYRRNSNLNEISSYPQAYRLAEYEEDSLNEKLRHNAYFDLSTTSESEVTSAKNAIKKKMLPISINLDDTTQSDTFSVSMHVPTKLSSKSKLGIPTHLLDLSVTSDPSESTAKSNLQNPPPVIISSKKPSSGVKNLINDEDEIEKMAYMEQSFVVRQQNGRQDSLPVNNNYNNDNELELLTDSDSSTTSPGDSVMDSVQNRTLNESLGTMDLKCIPERAKDFTKSSPSGSDLLTAAKQGRDVFLVSSEEKLINEDENKSDEKRVTESSVTFTQFSTVQVSSARKEDYSKISEKKPEVVEELVRDASPSPFKVLTKPSDILNNFTKIEDEFTIENDTLLEMESWEKNTISIDSTQVKEEPKTKLQPDTEEKVLEKVTSKQEDSNHTKNILTEKTASSEPSSSTQADRPATSNSSRRVKIKLDYEDSDSEASDAKEKAPKVSQADTTAGRSEPKKQNAVDTVDDDFDDFFDI